MAFPILLKTQNSRQSSQPVLNRSHPLLAGAIMVYDGATGMDLWRGKRLYAWNNGTSSATGPQPVVRAAGPYGRYSVAASSGSHVIGDAKVADSGSMGVYQVPTSAITYAVVSIFSSAATYSTRVQSGCITGNAVGFQIGTHFSTPLIFASMKVSTSISVDSAAAPPMNQPVAISMSYSATSGVLRLSVNGKQTTTSGSGNINYATATNFDVGAINADSSLAASAQQLVILSTREWKPWEHASFARNPWQIFETPQMMMIYAPTSSDTPFVARAPYITGCLSIKS